MGQVHDQEELDAYKHVLLNLDNVTGYIQWRRLPREWLDENLHNFTPKSVLPKPYPVRCIACGEKQVRPTVVRHELQKNHDGRLYDLTIEQLPVNQCKSCGELYFTDESDNAISSALRAKLNLLTPVEIRANIEALGMQQKQVAECLGIAPETLSRWLNGSMIQSRALDNLMRAYFGCAEVRAKLIGEKMDQGFGRQVTSDTRDFAEL